jgi:hypothetical protein
MTYGASEFDALALAKIDPEDVELLDLRYEFAVKRMKRHLDSLYRKLPLRLSSAKEAALVSQINRMQRLVSRIRHTLAGRD